MDLFEFAKSAMEYEVKEKEEQELLEAPAKSYKVDIFEALRNVAQKNYGWYRDLEENQKAFSPYMMNLWLCHISDKSPKKTRNDVGWEMLSEQFNKYLNINVFQCSDKGLLWLIACAIPDDRMREFSFNWIKKPKEESDEISTAELDLFCKYVSKELWVSKERIRELYGIGLITAEDIHSMLEDIYTVEGDPKKAKKK